MAHGVASRPLSDTDAAIVSPFHKSFLREVLPPGTRAHLAAFGKHPGWNDHIDDLGLDTESLALAKQQIYFGGLSGQIDAGAWDKLDPAHRLEGFDHLFIWRRGDNVLLGSIVTSRDGKGRTRYPMILCAQFAKLPLSRVLRELRPHLDAAMNACRATTSADAVRQIVTDARDTLRRAVGAARAVATPEAPTAAAARLIGQSALGPANEGLCRILYQIKNHLAPWAPGRGDPDKDAAAALGVHLRVPRVLGGDEEALAAWSGFLGSQLDRQAPLLLILPRGGAWLDAIVGEPVAADFFGLRANMRAIPCASDVPYELDEAFRLNATTLLADLARGLPSPRTIFGAGDSGPSGRKLSQHAASARQIAHEGILQPLQRLREGMKLRNWLVLAAVALLVATVALAGFFFSRRPRSEPATSSPSSTAPPTLTTPSPSTGAVDVNADWKALCGSYFHWMAGLQAALNDSGRRERWTRDPHLRTTVLARVGPANEPGQLDPRVLTGASGSLQTLGETPPAALSVPATAQKVENAARVVEQLAAAFAAWPVPGQVRTDVAKLGQWGWSRATADLRLPATLLLNGELPATVDRLLVAGGQLAAVMVHAEAVQAGVKRLVASGDPALAALGPTLLREPATARSPDELSAALQRLRAEIEPIVAVLGGDWDSGRIDRARFLKERGETWATGVTGVALLKKWVADVANYAPVAEGAAALPTTEWQGALASAKNSRTQLAAVAPAEVEPFAQRQAKLEREWTALNAERVARNELAARAAKATALVGAMKTLGADLASEVGRRANPATWAQQLRTTQFAESAVVDARWQQKRDALLKANALEALQADLPRFLAVRRRAERIEQFLRQLASTASLPETLTAEEVPDAGIARDLRARMVSLREAALGKLIRSPIWNDKDELPTETAEEFWRMSSVKNVVKDYMTEYGNLRGFGADATRIGNSLDVGCAWQDQLDKSYAQWRESWAKEAGSKVLPRVGEVVARFENLTRLAVSTDRIQLNLAVQSGLLAESVTAWRRLGELPDWLSTPEDLRFEQQFAATLKIRGEREIKPASGLDAFQKHLATQGRNRWKAALGRATTNEGIGRLFGAMDAFGVSESELNVVQKFNLLLHRLKTKSWASLSKEAGRAARDEAVAALSAAAAAGPAPVAALIGQLEKVGFEEVGVDFGAEGPGKMEWKLEPSTRANVVGYVWKGPGERTHRLEFLSVALPSGQNAYLCTTEMPVQLFLDWVEHRKIWKDMIEAQKTMLDDSGSIDPRRGPWTYVVKKNVTRDLWRFSRESSSWHVGSLDRSAPTEQTPINYVSFTTAALFSRALNCRLPTEAEWQAARKLESEGGPEPSMSNLRDQRWRKQFEFQSGQPLRSQCWPDSDIFLARGLPKGFGREATAKAATEKDDGYLWFADVRSGPARLLWHLVGNVAEFVTNAQGRVGVLGGSALSPPEMPADQLFEVEPGDAQRGFADVGFRPAFSAGKQSGALRVQGIFASAPFLTAQK